MPAVLAANRQPSAAKTVRLSASLARSGGFDGFRTIVRDWRADLAGPDTLVEFGVPRGAFDRIRDMSVNDPTAGGNPIELTSDLATRMLETAFGV
jgi:alcohol dehydrogenase